MLPPSAPVGAGTGSIPEAAPFAASLGFFGFDPEQVRRLGGGDVLVFDDVLGRESASAVSAALRAAPGDLTPAGIGRGGDHRLVTGVRGDLTRWLARTDAPPVASLWELLDRVADEVRRRAYLGVEELEVQLALYPGNGTSYLPHRDAFASQGRRRVTAIYYLNGAWLPGDGGELRVVTPEGVLEIAPLLDRLVLYRSALVEHEVLPARAPRWAVTAWLLGPLEVG